MSVCGISPLTAPTVVVAMPRTRGEKGTKAGNSKGKKGKEEVNEDSRGEEHDADEEKLEEKEGSTAGGADGEGEGVTPGGPTETPTGGQGTSDEEDIDPAEGDQDEGDDEEKEDQAQEKGDGGDEGDGRKDTEDEGDGSAKGGGITFWEPAEGQPTETKMLMESVQALQKQVAELQERLSTTEGKSRGARNRAWQHKGGLDLTKLDYNVALYAATRTRAHLATCTLMFCCLQ